MTMAQHYTDKDGHVFVVSWSQLNPGVRISEPEYNVWVTRDGEEIEMLTHVYREDVVSRLREYQRRCGK